MRVGHCCKDQRERRGGDGSEIAGSPVSKEGASEPDGDAGLPTDASFELLASVADEVIPDVSLARRWRVFRDLTRAFDAL